MQNNYGKAGGKILKEAQYKPYLYRRYIDMFSFWVHGDDKLKMFIDLNKTHPTKKVMAGWSNSTINLSDVAVTMKME